MQGSMCGWQFHLGLNLFCHGGVSSALTCSPSPHVAACGGTSYGCQIAKALLRHPTGQVMLATWVAVVAGLVAWYFM